MGFVPGAGIDVVSMARIGKLSQSALERLFTRQELEFVQGTPARKLERLSARFAAKEAVLKCLGTGLTKGIGWHDIEICTDPASGAPWVRLHGAAALRHQELGGKPIALSLSHDGGIAMAVAIFSAQ